MTFFISISQNVIFQALPNSTPRPSSPFEAAAAATPHNNSRVAMSTTTMTTTAMATTATIAANKQGRELLHHGAAKGARSKVQRCAPARVRVLEDAPSKAPADAGAWVDAQRWGDVGVVQWNTI